MPLVSLHGITRRLTCLDVHRIFAFRHLHRLKVVFPLTEILLVSKIVTTFESIENFSIHIAKRFLVNETQLIAVLKQHKQWNSILGVDF